MEWLWTQGTGCRAPANFTNRQIAASLRYLYSWMSFSSSSTADHFYIGVLSWQKFGPSNSFFANNVSPILFIDWANKYLNCRYAHFEIDNNGWISKNSRENFSKNKLCLLLQAEPRFLRRRLPNPRPQHRAALGPKSDRPEPDKQAEQNAWGDGRDQRAEKAEAPWNSEAEVNGEVVRADGSGIGAGVLWRSLQTDQTDQPRFWILGQKAQDHEVLSRPNTLNTRLPWLAGHCS